MGTKTKSSHTIKYEQLYVLNRMNVNQARKSLFGHHLAGLKEQIQIFSN